MDVRSFSIVGYSRCWWTIFGAAFNWLIQVILSEHWS